MDSHRQKLYHVYWPLLNLKPYDVIFIIHLVIDISTCPDIYSSISRCAENVRIGWASGEGVCFDFILRQKRDPSMPTKSVTDLQVLLTCPRLALGSVGRAKEYQFKSS